MGVGERVYHPQRIRRVKRDSEVLRNYNELKTRLLQRIQKETDRRTADSGKPLAAGTPTEQIAVLFKSIYYYRSVLNNFGNMFHTTETPPLARETTTTMKWIGDHSRKTFVYWVLKQWKI